jgi:DNA polymerase
MGYGGGVGAFVKMAATNRLDLNSLLGAPIPEGIRAAAEHNYEYAVEQGRDAGMNRDLWVVCESLKLMWREAHPKIVKGWKDLEWAAKRAVANPGTVTDVAGGKIKFKVEGQWLVMRLPSGRKIRYFRPHIASDDTLIYLGIDTDSRKWGTTSTYGGKLCENEDQGGCRDLLVGALFGFELGGYEICIHVHDEPVAEVPIGALSDDTVKRIMCKVPSWAAGFPLAIEGHRGKRYRK